MKKVLFEGPYLTMSGYGEHARLILRALKENKDIDVYGLPLDWGRTGWLSGDDEERSYLDEISIKSATSDVKDFDLHVFVGIPPEFKKKAKKAVCVTAGIEVDRVDPQWLIKSYEFEKIIVPSEYSRSVFMNSTYETDASKEKNIKPLECMCPVEVIGYPTRQYEADSSFDIDFTTDFNFLSVAQWGPRKNIESSVKWFLETFKDNPNVGLILKSNLARNCIMDQSATSKTIEGILSTLDPQNERQCKLYLLHGDLTEQQLGALYTHSKVKAMVSTSHGEGFGLPLFEAVCHEMPVIATNATGHLDFLYAPDETEKLVSHFAKVDFTVDKVLPHAVWEGIIPEDARWTVPIESSFKSSLLDVYNNYENHKETAVRLKKFAFTKFDKKEIYHLINSSINEVIDDGDVSEIENINKRIFS